MPALSRLDVSNEAIALLPAEPISSVDENSLPARECRRSYPSVISALLEGPHDYSFANQRALMAQLATNDRPSEWAYAYALPANLGSPIRVLPDFDSLGIGIPVPLPGDPYAEAWSTWATSFETPYEIQGSTLFSNTQNATLEYTINDVAGLNVSRLFLDALALRLAAKICVPVKKDSDRESKLMTAAEAAEQRAIADDRNRNPQTYGDWYSETLAARQGYLSGAW